MTNRRQYIVDINPTPEQIAFIMGEITERESLFINEGTPVANAAMERAAEMSDDELWNAIERGEA